jgi:PAS domain S-box-containing protein
VKYRFSELIDDLRPISKLFDYFNETTGVKCDIFELDGGSVTSASTWERVCVDFHRKNPDCERLCLESDTKLANSLLSDSAYAIYQCKNGMMDAAARVMVRGEHVANVLAGQVFCQKPDIEWFRKRARKFGFEESSYLDAILKVPVLPRQKLEMALKYLSHFAELLGTLGLRHVKQLEAEEALRESESEYRNLFENAVEGVFRAGPDGRFLNVNPALARMQGFDSPGEMMEQFPSVASHLFVASRDRQQFLRLLRDEGVAGAFEARTRRRDGTKIWACLSARAVKDRNGKVVYEGIVESINERKEAELKMKASQNRLATLSRTLLRKMENERHYIAYELHDQIGQALTAVQMKLESMRSRLRPSGLDGYLDEGIEVIDGAMEQVRNLSLNLRPAVLDDLGLPAALDWLVNSMNKNKTLEVTIDVEGVHRCLRKEIEIACFRVAQEATTNVLRHARASKILLRLRRKKGWLVLTICDNGTGFDVRWAQARCAKGGSFGLMGMEERVNLMGGTFDIESDTGAGTKIIARFPVGP